jgi:hypothetical protein
MIPPSGVKNAGRAAKYFERTFNYTPRQTKLAKPYPVYSLRLSPLPQQVLSVFSAVKAFERQVR